MPRSSPVTLPQAAVEHMNPVAREHLPAHLQANFPVGADFEGATINYFYEYAKPPAGFHFEQDLTIGSGIELPLFPGGKYVPSVGYLDISGNSLTIDFTQNASFSGLSNSFTLSDPYNLVPDITGVTLVDNGGSTGLPPGAITFDANSVTVNLLGTSFAAGSEISMTFSFI